MKKDPAIDARGVLILDGVELINMGQFDTEKAAIQFFMTNTPGESTIIRNSAIHDSNGQSIHAEYAYHVILDSNVFFNSFQSMIYSMNHVDWTITNNLFIGLQKRVLPAAPVAWDATSFIYMYTAYNPETDTMKVSNNIG
jgi:hypothetical protein